MLTHVDRSELAASVNADPRTANRMRVPDANFDRALPLIADLPERGCAAVTENGVKATGKNRSHPAPLGRKVGPTDGIDTTAHLM
jgi:hypothetical protein